jgi:hypothetical protein
MATTKKLQTLVQLQQREGMVFEVLGNLTELPSWFHAEYLRSPKAVQLEAWLVETIFGERGRERVVHSASSSHPHLYTPTPSGHVPEEI